jgi:hypothetical protein
LLANFGVYIAITLATVKTFYFCGRVCLSFHRHLQMSAAVIQRLINRLFYIIHQKKAVCICFLYATSCVKIHELYATLRMILLPHPSFLEMHFSADAVVQKSAKPKFRTVLFVKAPRIMKIDIYPHILVPVSEIPRGWVHGNPF